MQRPRFFLRRAALIMALLLFALPARALDLSRDELRARQEGPGQGAVSGDGQL